MKLQINQRQYYSIMFILGLFLALTTTYIILAQTSDSISGSFQLDATPDVNSVDFVDSSYSLVSTIVPDNTQIFGVNFTIDHSATMDDIKNITVFVFDDSVHGADWDSPDVDANGYDLITLNWTESTGAWTLSQGAFSEWTEQSSIDPGPASGLSTFDFSAQFDISWAALADTDWNATVIVYDDDEDTDEDAETGLVTMANNFDVSFSALTLTWGNSIVQGSTNNTHEAITLQIRANAQWELRINGTDFSPNSQDIDANDILVWDQTGGPGGNSQVIKSGVAVVLDCNNKCSDSTWNNEAAMTDEANITRSVFIFLNELSIFEFGVSHSTIIGILIALDV